MNLYLSGKMRGQKDNGFAAFDAAAKDLRKRGHHVVSPADHDRELGWDETTQPDADSLASTMVWDLTQVAHCEGVVCLPGWEKSRGATAEVALAVALEKEVYSYPSLIPIAQFWPKTDEWRGADFPMSREERAVRKFDTGATRDTDEGKLDYEAFLSPLALRRYAEYLHSHRRQSDGTLRSGDNWTKGIPRSAYMKSLLRHVMDVWSLHRKVEAREDLQTALCAVIFNAFGYLYEDLQGRDCGTQE